MTATATRTLAPANPTVELVEYNTETGIGFIEINGTQYLMVAVRVDGITTALRLRKCADNDRDAYAYTITFGKPSWGCTCDDAKYRPGRPGGCKHVAALKIAANQLRCCKP